MACSATSIALGSFLHLFNLHPEATFDIFGIRETPLLLQLRDLSSFLLPRRR